MDRKIIFIKDTDSKKSARLNEFIDCFQSKLTDNNIDYVNIIKIADIGIYHKGISIKILPDNITYCNISIDDIGKIIDITIKNSQVVAGLDLFEKNTQLRIVLRHCGVIDPENIDEYLALDGYEALEKTLFEYSPEHIIEELKKSGLRGRGGGGYPTWLKWNLARKATGNQKYLICNADEGDPGAYMDRSMLEGDPHSIIEGMVIGGYAIGATVGYFYIRAEYPLAIERIENAIKQAYEYGLLGKNILGSGFDFDLEIRLGAGAFVCGEETALIASIEGKRGYPSPKPPYPTEKGLWGHSTTINNVETLANIPYIINYGGESFASIGLGNSKGTKVFAVTGNVANSGLVEVPMGITLNDIVYDIGGGSSSGLSIKAVQTGGPSGGVIPKDYFKTPVTYEHLHELGSIMGSGGMIVLDEDDCVVDIAKFYLKFCVDESCGKCSPCRIGGYQMLSILEDITEGKGTPKDIEKLEMISKGMQKASLCGLGQTAPNPVVSTLKYFKNEYNSHIEDKKCLSGKCVSLLSYTILPERCIKCGLCAKNCPVEAISGSLQEGYKIDTDLCIKCGRCVEVCNFDAIK